MIIPTISGSESEINSKNEKKKQKHNSIYLIRNVSRFSDTGSYNTVRSFVSLNIGTHEFEYNLSVIHFTTTQEFNLKTKMFKWYYL